MGLLCAVCTVNDGCSFHLKVEKQPPGSRVLFQQF